MNNMSAQGLRHAYAISLLQWMKQNGHYIELDIEEADSAHQEAWPWDWFERVMLAGGINEFDAARAGLMIRCVCLEATRRDAKPHSEFIGRSLSLMQELNGDQRRATNALENWPEFLSVALDDIDEDVPF